MQEENVKHYTHQDQACNTKQHITPLEAAAEFLRSSIDELERWQNAHKLIDQCLREAERRVEISKRNLEVIARSGP